MNLAYYVVDAFATKVFEGNPAAVFILPEWLPEDLMQKIAIENNLSETAFAVKEADSYSLRWFTPDREIDLCGHATLATAFVLFHYYEPQRTSIVFQTKYSGQLRVTKNDEILSLDFPAIRPEKTAILPVYEEAIGVKINEAYLARDLFFVLDNETQIRQLTPNFSLIKTFEQ
ncbi:PhzF family phenazine biosynthesis protein, partial [Listeria monocytogenes]|nr:PhzF family phenazine biosynthesis protein [Listeria monocytogenes]